MTGEHALPENKKDDLDLIMLLGRIFSFFRNYGRLIAICSVAGMLLGLLLFFVLPKRYSSTLLLHSFTLTNTEQINIIDNWNELLKKREYDAISADFNCDPEMLKKISSIKASEIQKLYIQNNPNGFLVEVIVTDTGVLDALQKGIINGLENGEYLKARLESKKSNLRHLIEKVKIEIARLDSTKKDIENSINNSNRSSSSYIIDVSGLTGQMIGLNEKLLGYQEDLKFTHAVQVLHNFAKFKKPDSPKLFKLLVLGFIAGFSIGYILAIYKYVQKRIKYSNANSNL
ncbi:MAG TPA: hypothetical protein VMY77_06475 [Chitinophagaceae bacterium]|nr:hypothetical protein [Chitinophagaceae bacterium]